MASFASRVKEELARSTRMPPHCRRAVNAARRIYRTAGPAERNGGSRSAGRPADAAYEPYLLKKDCCVRSYLRGAFLAAGTVSDPAKSYHFEITCPHEEEAVYLMSLLARCGVESREMERKGQPVIYIKEGGQIRDLLTMMGAPVAMMDFENARIINGMRGNVNRRVNCETSNINKAVAAGIRQVRAIRTLRESGELYTLPDSLQDAAQARLDHPDATLEELGQMMNPPVSKSGVNHRLRKLCALAEGE